MTSQSVEAANLGNSKLTVVGAGSVGTSIAYASLIRGSARQIALYDIDRSTPEQREAFLARVERSMARLR